MKKTIQIIVLAALCLNFSTYSQVKPPSSTFSQPTEKAIYQGGILPESFYNFKHRAVGANTKGSYTLSMDQYKDKLIILDFWATWCKPCIYSLNKMDSLQRVSSYEDFVIIPITYHNAESTQAFLRQRNWVLPSITGDTILKTYFPHQSIPHAIWIKNGKVLAISNSMYVNSANIRRAIIGEQLILKQKITIDPSQPMSIAANYKPAFYQSAITRNNSLLDQHILDSLVTDHQTVLFAHNVDVLHLYLEAYKEQLPAHTGVERIVLDLDSGLRNRITRPLKADSTWRADNRYCYYLSVPKKVSIANAKALMRQDLDRFFSNHLGIIARIEQRAEPTLILTAKQF